MKVLVLTFVMALVSFAASANDAVPEPEYFPGEYWEYDVSVDRSGSSVSSSRRLANGIYQVSISANGSIEADLAFTSYEGTGRPSIHDPSTVIRWLRFPFRVGDSWPVEYHRSSTKHWVYATAKVEAVETVTVPAGSFEAYRIVLEEDWRLTRYWYSPKTKSVVKLYQEQYQSDGTAVNQTNIDLTTYGRKGAS